MIVVILIGVDYVYNDSKGLIMIIMFVIIVDYDYNDVNYSLVTGVCHLPLLFSWW